MTTAQMPSISLAGVVMRAVATTAEASALNAQTEFTFDQIGDIFSARYRGGPIVDGYLIGKILPGDLIGFRYVQADKDGRLDAGVSTGVISRLPDGRLRLTEDFQWTTRPGSGQNIFEEAVHGQLATSRDRLAADHATRAC